MGKVLMVGVGVLVLVVAILFYHNNNPFTQKGRLHTLLHIHHTLAETTPLEREGEVWFPPRWLQKAAFQFFAFWEETVKAAFMPIELRLAEKVVAVWNSKAIYAAVKLGIPDIIPIPSPFLGILIIIIIIIIIFLYYYFLFLLVLFY